MAWWGALLLVYTNERNFTFLVPWLILVGTVLFEGNHRKHAKRATMSNHLECRFGAGPEPDCRSWVAIGGALLRFQGDRVAGGAGRYLGATGRILSNKEVPGGNDVVARVTLR